MCLLISAALPDHELSAYAVDRTHDFGLDLAVGTFDQQGFLESGVVWFRMKATDHLKTSKDGKAVLATVDRRDVLAWIEEANPIILVIYGTATDCAYWLVIQVFRRPTGFQ